MPSLRDLARRAVSRALGVNAEPPKPPVVSFARVSPAVQRVNAERDRATAPAASPSPAPRATARAAVEQHLGNDDQLAEALATIACGAQELVERIDAGEPVTLLDVREPFETLGGVVPEAIRIPLGELPARWRELEAADEVVCYCDSGARSLEAARLLRANGLFNATSLDGGIGAWMGVGGRVVRPAQDKGSG